MSPDGSSKDLWGSLGLEQKHREQIHAWLTRWSDLIRECGDERKLFRENKVHDGFSSVFSRESSSSLIKLHTREHCQCQGHVIMCTYCTCLNTTMLSWVALSDSATSLEVEIPKYRVSWESAAARNALAASVSVLSKNPMTTTSSFSLKVLASSGVVRSAAGGPVFFFSHVMISGEVLPPTG